MDENTALPVGLDEFQAIETPAGANTLSNLILKFHDLMLEARDLIEAYRVKHNTLVERHKDMIVRENRASSLLRSVEAREGACKRVEDVQKLHHEATTLMDSAQLRLNAAVEAERKHRLYVDDENKKLAEIRLETQKEANAVLAQRKGIDAEVSKRANKILADIGHPQEAT